MQDQEICIENFICELMELILKYKPYLSESKIKEILSIASEEERLNELLKLQRNRKI